MHYAARDWRFACSVVRKVRTGCVMRPKADQVKTSTTTVAKIMRTAAFRQGLADRRAGLRPRFDIVTHDVNQQWNYERGRQWAVIAPRALPLMYGRKLNPDAVAIYERSDIP